MTTTKQEVTLDKRTVLEIIQHEAIIRQAYRDQKGIWTWGVGVTNASGHNVERYIDKPQKMEHVLNVYIWLLETHYLPDVLEAFAGYNLKQHELAAALSFHWNTGAIKKAMWVKQIKAGNRQAAYSSFMNYQKPVSIKPRREAERNLFFNGIWSNKDGMVTEYTQVTAKHTPDWKSGRKVNVAPILDQIMYTQPIVDRADQPAYNPPSTASWWNSIKAWLSRFFK
jgi:GH24 family phage-related lysozyme (muramidase)